MNGEDWRKEINGVTFTDTIEFIDAKTVPSNRDVMCRLSYSEDPGSPVASLIETKILVSSIISDAKHVARFMFLFIKDFVSHTNEASRIHEMTT